MSVGMMASPNAAVVEYALMKDAEAQGSASGNAQPRIPEDHDSPQWAREGHCVRTNVEMRKDGCNWRGEIEGTGEPVVLMWWKGGVQRHVHLRRPHVQPQEHGRRGARGRGDGPRQDAARPWRDALHRGGGHRPTRTIRWSPGARAT